MLGQFFWMIATRNSSIIVTVNTISVLPYTPLGIGVKWGYMSVVSTLSLEYTTCENTVS